MPSVSEADTTLQAKIDGASKGDTIEIEEGEYEETINIAKPITLVGKGEVLLRSCEEEASYYDKWRVRYFKKY